MKFNSLKQSLYFSNILLINVSCFNVISKNRLEKSSKDKVSIKLDRCEINAKWRESHKHRPVYCLLVIDINTETVIFFLINKLNGKRNRWLSQAETQNAVNCRRSWHSNVRKYLSQRKPVQAECTVYGGACKANKKLVNGSISGCVNWCLTTHCASLMCARVHVIFLPAETNLTLVPWFNC